MSHFSLYIHIPFCVSKCKYCDFYSTCLKDIPQEEYFEALKKELLLSSKKDIWKEREILSIYFGGGTPSLILPKYYEDFLSEVKNLFPLENNIEITLEANPKTLTKENLILYKQCGINRLSLGVQSFNNEILKFLGRAHKKEDAIKTFCLAREVGFKNISLDFIYGIPNQKILDIENDLIEIKKLSPEHLSFYALTIEENTVFGKMKKDGIFTEVSEDDFVKMDETISEGLKELGYNRYEISNYAKNGMESKHNMFYWDANDYLGLGAGAFGAYCEYENGYAVRGERYSNIKSFRKYIDDIKAGKSIVDFLEKNEKKVLIFEYILVNLRKRKGISFNNFYQKFGVNFLDLYGDILNSLKEDCLIDIDDFGFSISKQSILITSSILEEFL